MPSPRHTCLVTSQRRQRGLVAAAAMTAVLLLALAGATWMTVLRAGGSSALATAQADLETASRPVPAWREMLSATVGACILLSARENHLVPLWRSRAVGRAMAASCMDETAAQVGGVPAKWRLIEAALPDTASAVSVSSITKPGR